MAARTSKHSVVATSAGRLAFDVSVREHVVTTDQPARAGGNDSSPTPLELLTAALASCIALYVHKFCASIGLDSSDLAVEVKPLWQEEPGRIARFDVIVHLPDTIPAAHHAAILRVARTCPVHNTLMHAPEVTVEVRELVPAQAPNA